MPVKLRYALRTAAAFNPPRDARVAGIADDPDTRRLRHPGRRRGSKKMTIAAGEDAAGEDLRSATDGIIIKSVGRETRERHDVLGGDRRQVDSIGKTSWASTIADPAIGRHAGAPSDDDARRRAELQVRTARNRLGHGDVRVANTIADARSRTSRHTAKVRNSAKGAARRQKIVLSQLSVSRQKNLSLRFV